MAAHFRALGHPTRLRILELLRQEGELTVGELSARLGVGQTNVSSHLASLRWCGFLESRREYRIVRNRIADERLFRIVELAEELVANRREPASLRRADEDGGASR